MAVSQDLIEILVCPVDRAPIEYKERRKVIICTSCGRHYPVRDNIPVMLVDEATIPSARGGGSGDGVEDLADDAVDGSGDAVAADAAAADDGAAGDDGSADDPA